MSIPAALGIIALLTLAVACHDSADELAAQEASSTQAAMIVADLMPRVLDFSDEARRLAQAALATAAASQSADAECSPVTGVETEYL